jgi:NAD(P)-dependent dehydrogenase (short-subunit alcohol dehydrogenase family)
MNRLKNKVAIITGAAGGMGASEAKLFAREGASVMATDMQEKKLRTWVEEAKKQGLKIEYMKHDVTSESEWEQVINKTLSLYGHIDILVNNAGVFPGFSECEDTTTATWNKIIAINLTGPFLGCRACVPHLRNAGGGSIVNIASIAGLVGGNGPAYTASKGGLRLLTKDLAVTLAKYKIRVNSICPGGVLTPMTEGLLASPEMAETIKNLSPQGRVADPIEIAWGVLYLASDESTFTTGADLTIDGGAVAK